MNTLIWNFHEWYQRTQFIIILLCSVLDIDECMMAALAGEELCMIPMMCKNTNGNFDCVCPPGSEPFEFNNRTMCREGTYIANIKHLLYT